MTLKLVTRAQWGARPPKYKNYGALSAESTCHWNGPKITIGGKTTWDHSKCASLVRGIQNFHMDGRGWSDVAYNFLVCPHGYAFEGRGFNVINGANGTNSGNRSSHAVCCIAGEGNPFSEEEKVGFKECIKYIDTHTLAPSTCKGHRDHKLTKCPGDARYSWVHQGMPLASAPKPPDQEKDMLDATDKEWLRSLATEIAGQRVEVDDYGQTGVRRDVWRWSAESVTLLRELTSANIAAAVVEALEPGVALTAETMAAIAQAVETGVRNALEETNNPSG